MSSIYNGFAKDFDLKRKNPWKSLVEFYKLLANEGYTIDGTILDAGCGNGRNMVLFESNERTNRIIGLDNSTELLKIAKNNQNTNKNTQFILADLNFLPFRKSSLNSVFAIASIHHLENEKSRSEFIEEIFHDISGEGLLILTVWRKWQKRFRNHFFKDWIKRKISRIYKEDEKNKGLLEFGDIFIPWKKSDGQGESQRFYHLFSKREVRSMMKIFSVKKFSILGGPNNKDNFFICAQKQI